MLRTLHAFLWPASTPDADTAVPCFVFGSNKKGLHRKGAALFALEHRGAVLGQAEGAMGNAYAIPTKDERLKTLRVSEIAGGVLRFIAYAKAHPEVAFEVSAIGCGLAGLTPAQVAPFFTTAPSNCRLPERFLPFVPERGQPRVRTEVARNVPHPSSGADGFDRLVIFAATRALLRDALDAAASKQWQVAYADEGLELVAILSKPHTPNTSTRGR